MALVRSLLALFVTAATASTTLAAGLGENTSGVLVLSGGSSPVSNHYSQYLQTKTLTEGLRVLLNGTSVEVLFGAGNSDALPHVLADVHRQSGGVSDMQFGIISGNAAATKEGVEAWFAERAPVEGSKTFFLFVSDHGMANPDTRFGTNNNCVNLWAYDAEAMASRGDDAECLSKDELRELIKKHVKADRTVFAMSQCFSGGFHQMSVTSSGGYPTADVNLCGFTAITEDTTASGCTPDVDGPGYKGYERFFTQQLVGRDVVTGATLSRAGSVVLAHQNAMDQDPTKDIPISTSDYLLREWAERVKAASFKPRSSGSLAAARKAIDDALDGRVDLSDLEGNGSPWLAIVQEKSKRLKAQVAFLGGVDGDLKSNLSSGSLKDLLAVQDKILDQRHALSRQAAALEAETNRSFDEQLYPEWVSAIDQADATRTGLTAQELDFEVSVMLRASNSGKDPGSQCLRELARLKTQDDLKAYEALRAYCGSRGAKMKTFFLSQPKLATLAKRTFELSDQVNSLYDEDNVLRLKSDHVRRIVILRKVVAGAVGLEALADSKALVNVQDLLACEKSPF